MNIQQLEYFIEVCKTGNVTKAANILHVSQTAVTKQIHLLEEELGSTLFDRINKRMYLNDKGEFFLKEAKDSVKQFYLSKTNMEEYLDGTRGKLKIGFLKNLDPSLLIKINNDFNELYPHLILDFKSYSSFNLYENLELGNIDVGLGIKKDSNELETILIKEYPLVALVNKKSKLAVKDYIYDKELEDVIYDVRETNQLNATNDIESNILKVACGKGCAILHQFMQNNYCKEFVNTIPLKPIRKKGIYLIYNPQKHKSQIDIFKQYIHNNY
ncbi:MAG: LysR family transcriptional regulator [Thomasclavelia sp.]|nr:LysR family transcriptional regulator [Thomasclavelia sp.]